MRMLLTGMSIVALCATTMLLLPAPASAQVVELLPNLRPFPAFNVQLGTSTSSGPKEIRFSTRSWNSGDGPLELVAGGLDDSGGQNVFQRVYNSDGTFQDYFAGTFVYHPSHNHFHFGDYALYSLDPVNAPGASSKNGSKTTFCVMDTNKIDGSLPGAPQNAVYATCGNQVQGMSVGWADTYGSQLAGQSVDFSGNPSGDYCLTITIDPKGRLQEIDETDNIVSSLLRVDLASSTVTVLDPFTCNPARVQSISPKTGKAGTQVNVVITGQNFAEGMPVTFGGGSGPAPSVSNVVVDPSGTTITATVTIKKGKPGKDPVWDLHVGSGALGVLPNIFTVTP